jgi:trigger factor
MVERLPESRVKLDIAADQEEFDRAMDRAFRKVTAQVTVPGFRRGKAPRHIIERLYGREVFIEEAHRGLMDDLYRRAIEQEELNPVGPPEVDLVAPEPLAFAVTVPVFPTIDPGPYTEVRVDPIDATIDDDAIEAVIERVRRNQSPWVDPAPTDEMELGPDKVLRPKTRTPHEGDQVTVDYAVTENGEPFQEPVEDAVFILGESNLFPRLREELEKLHFGETASFTIAFAEDDDTVAEAVRGKTLSYTVTLKGLKERDLLPLDDEFAQSLDAETLDDLRRAVRDDLHQERTAEARAEVLSQVLDKLAEGANLELPAPMIDEEVEDGLRTFRSQLAQRRSSLEEYLRQNQQTEDDIRAELRPAAERRLRNSLLMRAVAEREQIEVGDEDVESEIERLSNAGGSADPERLRELYRSDYFRNMLRGELFERRLTDRLIDIATEGRGAVLNGWVPPEPPPVAEGESATAETTDEPTSVASAEALDTALTTGAMPGQPGDTATVVPEGDDAAVTVDDVAAEPDSAQAAAVGHEAETATLDEQAEPGEGGSNAPNPSY